MSRRVRRKVVTQGELKVDSPEIDENFTLGENEMPDWVSLPEDVVIQLFSRLNYRDRASLSSTCRTWRALGKSPFLWKVLDLRSHNCDAAAALLLASWCTNLEKLLFQGVKSVDAIIRLRAQNLREISGGCIEMTDAALCVLAARHDALERLHVDSGFSGRISSYPVKVCAMCCPQLQKLWLSGLREVDADAINALAKNCQNLTDVGFIDCWNVDVTALGNVTSLRYFSIAGTTHMKWDLAVQQWSKLPHLIGLDVSRTDIGPNNVLNLFSSSLSLKVLCALSCPAIEGNPAVVFNSNHKGKVLLAVFSDILKGVAKLFSHSSKNYAHVFLDWINSKKDVKLDEMFKWLEWVISFSLLRVSNSSSHGLHTFWLGQGITLLLSFIQSRQEEVQEWATATLGRVITIDGHNAHIDPQMAEAVVQGHGLRILLNLAQSLQEGIQSEATGVIADLLGNPKVAKSLIEEGGIIILVNLLQSSNRLVAADTAVGLWNLSVSEEYMGGIMKAGGVKALVDLIYKWSGDAGCERALECAAGTLANLATDEMCSIEVNSVGGIRALVMLACNCKVEKVQEQAARALTNLTGYGDINSNITAVGREAGAIDALVELVRSRHDGVRKEAAGALWNLSFDDANLEAIATAGGVQALVALACSCSDASCSLQKRAAGVLWGLSESETQSIAIVQEGGIPPLIAFAQSESQYVYETAVGALWNLSFYPENALRIAHDGGLPALLHICSSSASKYARFMSAMALAYMFDGRVDKIASIETSEDDSSNLRISAHSRMVALTQMEAFIFSFYDPPTFSSAAASLAPAALADVTESVRIPEVACLRCSEAEIRRFASMLRNSCPTIKLCATFALLQFSIGGASYAADHLILMQNAGVPRLLRGAAAATGNTQGTPLISKVFARIVLQNLELE